MAEVMDEVLNSKYMWMKKKHNLVKIFVHIIPSKNTQMMDIIDREALNI